jgi:hypothetical protein
MILEGSLITASKKFAESSFETADSTAAKKRWQLLTTGLV